MISIRRQIKLEKRPDWSPLGTIFKICDKHPQPFHMDVSTPAHELKAFTNRFFEPKLNMFSSEITNILSFLGRFRQDISKTGNISKS